MRIFILLMTEKEKKKRLVFIESDESADTIRERIKDRKLEDVDIWVRTPDSEKLDEMQLMARLCGSKKTCIAVAEM
jgi:hypothetical protein